MIRFGLRCTHAYSGNFVPAVKYTDQLKGYATSVKKILSNLNFSPFITISVLGFKVFLIRYQWVTLYCVNEYKLYLIVIVFLNKPCSNGLIKTTV